MRSYITIMLAVAALAFLPATAHAEGKSPAIRLMQLIDLSKTAKDAAMLTLEPMLKQLKASGIPDEGIKEVKEAADRFFSKTFDNPDMLKDMAKVYENTYSDEEMEELLLFYDTPLGRKSLVAMPQIMQEGAKVGQKYAQLNQADFQAEMQEIMLKYMGKHAEPDAELEPVPASE